MVDSISKLWQFLTVFFSSTVFADNVFLSLIVLMSIFGMIYIFMTFFEPDTWGW